jgi:pSer/pThr/pTyr-binding forkhead associated (FHA) protein
MDGRNLGSIDDAASEARPDRPRTRPAMNREAYLELFRRACGLAVPMTVAYQVAQSPVGEPSTLVSPAPFLLIGRSQRNDLPLVGQEVSRRHALLHAVAGRVACIDLKSRTQTFWDDRPQPQAWDWLDPGQSIRIGPYWIERTDRQPVEDRRHDRLDPFAPTEVQGVVADPVPRPVFELPFRVGGVASTWEMPGLLALVGRDDHCQFVLSDDSISRSHACLIRTPLGTWIVDLKAREGVYVNGTRVRWAWLADGDLVRFGRFTLVVRYDRRPEGIRRDDMPLEAGASPTKPLGEDQHGEFEPTNVEGRALALRPVARPPGLMKAAVPPRPFRSAEPATVNRGDWEPVLGTGPSPYALWQQQMQLMESFHNDMMMMVQMFIAMHRELQASVRDELKRVQKLTQELGRLNARLLQIPEPAAAGPNPNAVRPQDETRPIPREGRPITEATSRPRTTRRADAPTGSKPEERDSESRRTDRRGSIPADQENAGKGPIPRMERAEMYADITRRITELQRQRRGYWRRILKAISG